MTSRCYYDAAGCLVCPEQHAVAYVPARIDRQPVLGWNAGADMIPTHDGNLHVVFDMPSGQTALALGLKGSRERQTVPDLIEHGWYFQSLAGEDIAQVIERGVARTMPSAKIASDIFEIRRVNGAVTYWKNSTLVYTSLVRSEGAKIVNACLYASGDHVGEAA